MRPCGVNACLLKEEVSMSAMMCCRRKRERHLVEESDMFPWLWMGEPGG
jgi:hypothetical protein